MATTKKKTIVITGGAGGIGSACAEVLKEYKMVITDYATPDVEKAVEKLTKEDFDAVGKACDITNKEDVEKLMGFHYSKEILEALSIRHIGGFLWKELIVLQNLQKKRN